MFWKLSSAKLIFFIPPKVGCTTFKYFMYKLKNIQVSDLHYVHDVQMYLNSEFHTNIEESYELIKNNGYKCAIIVRNPYDKFLSGLVNKFIIHHPNNHEKNIAEIKCSPSPMVNNFYKYFQSNISDDFSLITLKDLIDFHTNEEFISQNIIDNHFTNIYSSLPFKDILKIDDYIIIKCENDVVKELNSLLKTNIIIDEKLNQSKYSSTDISQSELLNTCTNNELIKEHPYYIERVNNAFKYDFIYFNYDVKHT